MLYHLIHLYTLEARNDEATDCHIRLETINMTIIFTRSTLGKNNRTAFDRILKYIKCIKKLSQLLKQICHTTRSYCSEKDSLLLFGKFVSSLPLNTLACPNLDSSDLERKFLKERFKSFIQDCFTIRSGYGSQKVTKTVSPKDYISNWKDIL